MAGLMSLISTDELKTTALARLAERKKQPQIFHFDKDADELMLLFVPPDTETVVHYLDDRVGVLYLPDSLEIVGLQIENFERSFLPRYQNLQNVWHMMDRGVQPSNVWDLTLAVEKKKVMVAIEVIKASEPTLGEPAEEMVRVLEFA